MTHASLHACRRHVIAVGLGLTLASLLAGGCSGGGGAPAAASGLGGEFVAVGSNPPNHSRALLNDPVTIDFSHPVDLATVDFNSVNFDVFDPDGAPVGEHPVGTFALGVAAGDVDAGRRLEFRPKFPTNDSFDDGGLRPNRTYVVSLPTGVGTTSIRDLDARPLAASWSFTFTTPAGTTATELFRDTKPGGPRRVGFSLARLDFEGRGVLGAPGRTVQELRLEFDQPISPTSINLSSSIELDPSKREGDQRGRIFLEFDHDEDGDPGDYVWIPATVELERNTLAGATVVVRPIGVLPNDAEIRVIVEPTLEDLAGESNASVSAFDRVFARFVTERAPRPQFEAIVEEFLDHASTVDHDAPLLVPLAGVSDGVLHSRFPFDGQVSTLDFEPSARETVLNTSFTQVQPLNAAPINVAGGVFRFRNVTIPAGNSVRGTGPNPMVWLVSGDFILEGSLSVDGGDGDLVTTIRSANVPTAAGIGQCGGGSGGAGSPKIFARSFRGERGFGPGQVPNGGGRGGRIQCPDSDFARTGGGGGGGSFATEGDPEFGQQSNTYVQWTGVGGRSEIPGGTGGNPGNRPFRDSRDDNDFWGSGVNVHRGIRIQGELNAPRGGAGGGGGGDRGGQCSIAGDVFSDDKGGGGGAGGGVLIIQALGRVVIRGNGRISADGGHGGGGAFIGSNTSGGGGGGGSGGMIVIIAGESVEFAKRGATYANGNSTFSITADGGIGLSAPLLADKYVDHDIQYHEGRSTGGFGGMGIIQIMTPPGVDFDGTGSVLDDNIAVRQGGDYLTGDPKIRTIAWRGWPDEDGVRRDDHGEIISVVGDGDIRPAPILLPAPFGPTSRARSRWIELGAVRRVPGSSGMGRVDADPAPLPDFEFAGLRTEGDDSGYVDWDGGGTIVPVVLDDLSFRDVRIDGSHRGQSAFELTVDSRELSNQPDHRYTNYRAEFVDENGDGLLDLRILGHEALVGDAHRMFLEPAAVFPAEAVGLRVVAKFFEVETEGRVGLGPMSAQEPESSVRIGFAFHSDPTATDPSGRFPPIGFDSDVAGLMAAMAAQGRRPALVQWDVLFDARFRTVGLSAQMPRQALRYLVLPFRF